MSVNLEVLEQVKEAFTSNIAKEVIDEIEGYGKDWYVHLNDIVNHGCGGGTVGGLIYYSDTIKFHDDYEGEIDDIIDEFLQSSGISFADLVGDKFDLYDIDRLKNFKSWLAFEEVAYKIHDYIEQECKV